MRIAMIGTGYVGLVSGACFADFGHKVTCVDKDSSKIAGLDAGVMPIWEPGLEALVKANVERGRLNFTTDLTKGVENAEAVFIAVGTPARRGDGHADLTFVYEAVRELAKVIKPGTVVVTKSTVPVGTGKKLKHLIRERQKSPMRFSVVSNPEFLREGAAINDFMRPDRIVIGGDDEEAIGIMRELYRPLYLIETPFIITSLEGAELIKYAANAFLATKISFINEIANLCEKVGCDVHDVARGIGMDRRIGAKFLHPGPGFGGSCFPKDTLGLSAIAAQFSCESRIVDAVIQVNQQQRMAMVPKIERMVGSLRDKRIAVLGLAFKPETDDMREAPAIDIIRSLVDRGAKVCAYDPVAIDEARKHLPEIEYASDEYEAATGADVLVLVTEWNQFRALDMERIRSLMHAPKIADLRNIYEPSEVREFGFEYVGVGR